MNIDIKKVYFNLMRIRMIELSIAEEYSKQEMRCPVHLSVGQEPIAVGVCSYLTKKDKIFRRSYKNFMKGSILYFFLNLTYSLQPKVRN